MNNYKLFQELTHTNGSNYIYITKLSNADLLTRKSDGELTLVTGLKQENDGKIYWASGCYMLPIDVWFEKYLNR